MRGLRVAPTESSCIGSTHNVTVETEDGIEPSDTSLCSQYNCKRMTRLNTNSPLPGDVSVLCLLRQVLNHHGQLVSDVCVCLVPVLHHPYEQPTRDSYELIQSLYYTRAHRSGKHYLTKYRGNGYKRASLVEVLKIPPKRLEMNIVYHQLLSNLYSANPL